MNIRVWIAVAWGVVVGVLTFAAGPIAWLSVHPAIAFIQIVFTYLMIPGLIVAAGVGSLVPAAAINGLIHFAVFFFLLGFVPAFKTKAAREP